MKIVIPPARTTSRRTLRPEWKRSGRRALGALAATCLFAVGCGGSDGGSTTPSAAPTKEPTAISGKTKTVKIADFKYAPETVTVDAGSTVEFVNDDSTAHTATARDESFDTDTLNKGDMAKVKLDKPGKYEYYCRFHAFMKGEIDVR